MKKILVVLLSVLLVLSLVSCKNEESKKEDGELLKVVAPAGTPTISMLYMMENNKEIDGVKINYQVIKATDVLAGKIISGDVDFAVVPTNLAAKLYNKGAKYKYVGNSVWGILYIVSNENIKSFSDLKGKEVNMIGRGLTPDIIFRKVLKDNSLEPDKDVKFNYVSGSEELAKSYITRKTNLSLMPEPMLTKVLMKRTDSKVVLDLQKEWEKHNNSEFGIPQACLIVKEETAKNKPELVKKFIEAYREGINKYNENPKEIASYSKPDVTLLKPMIVEKVQPRVNLNFKDSKESKESLMEYFKILQSSNKKSIGGKLPDDNFFYEVK